MKFWDSSAIVPLLIGGPRREHALGRLENDPLMFVWWATPVEISSAAARQEREGLLSVAEASAILDRLRRLSQSWHEIQATGRLRETAQRLLRVHPLRAADSLQLAAAVTAAAGQNSSLDFMCFDQRLSDAARREGFPVLE